MLRSEKTKNVLLEGQVGDAEEVSWWWGGRILRWGWCAGVCVEAWRLLDADRDGGV